VQFYLVEQHLIDLDRLEISGRGERELYDPSQPDAALNRRVEFINLNS
jgi:flagellar motor protein MotB